MENLVAFGDPNEDPLEYYTSFEKIHPFVDGNGRLGSILFNWADLDNPVHPPEVKW